MATHNQLTVVSVYGHNDGSSAIPSISHSVNELFGSRGLLISLAKPKGLPNNIDWAKCEPIDYLQYSVFMMHCLHAYIHTDYALVVQDDGWVLNGKNFDQSYYGYDYIGAPSHCGRVEDRFYLNFSWRQFPERLVVQNGGFSLRSRRFLQACNRHGLVHRQANEIHNWNEDAQLSAIHRPRLEELGYRYASEEVAKQFSIEYAAPDFHDGLDFNALVGHHAQIRKLVGPKHIRLTVNAPDLDGIYGERAFLAFLQNTGYRIDHADGSPYQA